MQGEAVLGEMDLETTITVVLLVCMANVIACMAMQRHSAHCRAGKGVKDPFHYTEELVIESGLKRE